MTIALEEAKNLSLGDILHHKTAKNADGTPMRFKVNGQVKTWKKDKDRVRVPLKRGMYEYSYLTEDNLDNFSFASEKTRKDVHRIIQMPKLLKGTRVKLKSKVIGIAGYLPKKHQPKIGHTGTVDKRWNRNNYIIKWDGGIPQDNQVVNREALTIIHSKPSRRTSR